MTAPIIGRRFAFNTTESLAAEILAACDWLGQPISLFIRRAIEARLAEVAAEQARRKPKRRVQHDGEDRHVPA